MVESWNDLANLLVDSGLKLAVSIVCGFILGFERENRNKPAGLRTIILITVGSTLFMIVSQLVPFITDWPEATTRVDPSRIAAGVVQGIGFLGAGSIIQARGSVHGLTTAAVIWVAAGIGLCVGIGYPLLAVALTLAVVATLIALDPLGQWLSRHGTPRNLELFAPNDMLCMRRIEHALKQHGVRREDLIIQPRDGDEVRITATYYASSAEATSRLFEALARIEGIRGAPLDQSMPA